MLLRETQFRFKITALTVWQRPCQLKFRHSEHTPDTDGEHVTFNMSLVKLLHSETANDFDYCTEKTNSRKKEYTLHRKCYDDRGVIFINSLQIWTVCPEEEAC